MLFRSNFTDVTTEDGEESRGGLVVDAFIQSVDYDDARNASGGERVDNQVFELRYERVACHGGVLLYGSDDPASKRGVLACKLVRECGKDILEFLSVEVIPRTEEAGTEGTILRDSLGEGLGDGRLSGPSQPVEPEDVSFLWISSPSHYSSEDSLSGPEEARVVVTSLVSSIIHGTQLSH